MSAELLTAEDVAERLRISAGLVKRRTKAEGWPCVRFSAKTIRYTAEHVEEIIALHANAAAPKAVGISGQTSRSRGRSA